MKNSKHTILYIHGMGGGADSRIPSILNDYFSYSDVSRSQPECEQLSIKVICRTYSFDPEVAHAQIESWIEECQPDLIIGESLGSLHALRIYDRPVLLISPALNTPFFFSILSHCTWIPGVSSLFENIYRPREGDRQSMVFSTHVLKKYKYHGREALKFAQKSECNVHAFFGTRDHYRRSGIVSLRRWKNLFRGNFTLYDGTHFMEEEYIYSLLIPKIRQVLGL